MESSIPDVDIFICTYNRAKYLKESIESVLNQTYKNFNLIILDNCSTDDTEDVVKSFSDERLKYIRHVNNIGGIGNLNYAFEKAQSPFFVVFHDDDVMLPNMIEEEINQIKNNDKLAIISCKADVINRDGIGIKNNKSDGCVYFFSDGDYFASYLNKCDFIMFPSILYRTSFIRENDLSLEAAAGPSADAFLAFEIEKKGGTLGIINKSLMYYRHHGEQDSKISKMRMIHDLFSYVRNDSYYNSLLENNKGAQNVFYAKMMAWNSLFFLGNDTDKDFLLKLNESYITVLDVSRLNKFIFAFNIRILTWGSELFKKLYRVARCIKRVLS